jgi:hypothetical protein
MLIRWGPALTTVHILLTNVLAQPVERLTKVHATRIAMSVRLTACLKGQDWCVVSRKVLPMMPVLRPFQSEIRLEIRVNRP